MLDRNTKALNEKMAQDDHNDRVMRDYGAQAREILVDRVLATRYEDVLDVYEDDPHYWHKDAINKDDMDEALYYVAKELIDEDDVAELAHELHSERGNENE